MKKLLSLSLMLSLGLATVTPALNAAQSQANPAHASGWQAAKKWWRSGRNMKALNAQEQRAFRDLRKNFTIGAIIAVVTAMIGGGAAYLHRKSAGGAADVFAGPSGVAVQPPARPASRAARPASRATRPVVAPAVASRLGQELIDAIKQDDTNRVEDLLQRGADANATDYYGNTALEYAVPRGHKNIVELLLKHEADVNAHDDDGYTVLMKAAQLGKTSVVEPLLQYGADVNAQNEHGHTALMWAAEKGNKDTVERLLNAPKINVNVQDKFDRTALMWAAEAEHENIVQMLLDAEARTDFINTEKQTAKQIAQDLGNNDIVDLITEHEALQKMKK